jgi:hypothetical protein
VPRRTLSLALVALALLVAGCGGGGDSGPQTKEGFINDADNVCENLAGKFADAGSQSPGTASDIAKANDTLADLYDKLANGLTGVRLPVASAARRGAAGYVGSVRAADPLVAQLRATGAAFVAAAKTNDAQKFAVAGDNVRAALDAFRAARAKSDTLAVSYGLNFCGNLD